MYMYIKLEGKSFLLTRNSYPFLVDQEKCGDGHSRNFPYTKWNAQTPLPNSSKFAHRKPFKAYILPS